MAQLYLSASLRPTGFACKGPSADRYLNSTASARHKRVGWGARGLSGFNRARASLTARGSSTRRLSLDRTQMQVEDNLVNLSPGMAVTVEIKTGSRTVLTHLLSPLLKYKQER
jgi:hypothetical protein